MENTPISLTTQVKDAMKNAMRSKEKSRLATIRLILAAIKQREVDERITLDNSQVIAIMNKMVKQCRESIAQFDAAGRTELSAKEYEDITVIQTFLPAALPDAEIDKLITEAIATTQADSMKDMGKAMQFLREKIDGRADMSAVSRKLKTHLNA